MSDRRPRPRERWTIGETEVPLPRDWAGLWIRYRLSREGYVAILEHQEGRCGSCRRLPADGVPLVVDHREGRVWGLLHEGCNLDITPGVVTYLRDPPAWQIGEFVIPPEVEARNAARAERNRQAQRDWRRRRCAEVEERQATAGAATSYGEWLQSRLR